MWRKFDQYKEGSNFRSWAFEVAKLETLNYRRKIGRDKHIFSDELLNQLAEDATNSASQLEQERRAALPHCIEKLRDKDREILAKRYGEKESIAEYAQSVGRTPNAIYRQVWRIRHALLDCITNTLEASST